jgi:glycerol kinase
VIKPVIIALDQGTTSSRAIAFDHQLQPLASSQQEFAQHFPQTGWVEHDANDIWISQLQVMQNVAAQVRRLGGHKIVSIGITNQRETTVVWSRKTGQPIWRALVWQDRRTEAWCKQQRDAGLADYVNKRTGLVLDPYFSASKIAWVLEHVAGARAAAEKGELAFGTVDSWLMWNLTGGAVHATDETNASRTMLYNLERHTWDETLLSRWHIPRSMMPQVQASSSHFGVTKLEWLGESISIGGVAGDQQAALLGQGCVGPGQAKNTYGTGCFMLMHTGSEMALSKHGLITTASASSEDSFRDSRSEVRGVANAAGRYALEGSVFVAGAAVQWLRDGLQLIDSAADIEPLAKTVSDSGDVMFVPALTGLGSPYWDAGARGTMLGLSRGTTRGHIARAALEAIAFQSAELAFLMGEESGHPLQSLRVDGGATANNLLMQIQADLLGVPVVRPKFLESTARGAACLAAITAGWISGQAQVHEWLSEQAGIDYVFEPMQSRDWAASKMTRWKDAVKRSAHWVT